jgi:signal transduction histidine kinase/DNA-binding NarL/FixJ family response regulator
LAVLKVLLVEDSPEDAELALLELGRGGYQVRHRRVDRADAMAEALAAESWDVVLSDFQIPGFGGLAALRVLQASGLDLPFILVSGVIGEETAVAALKAGANGFVAKHNLGRLAVVVERELREAGARREQARAKAELARSEADYRGLFEHSPLPLSVQDFSAAMAFLRQAPGGAATREWLQERPATLERCRAAVRMVESNRAWAAFYGVPPGAPAADGRCLRLAEESVAVFRDLLAALAGGARTFQAEAAVLAAGGAARTAVVHVSVSPGHEAALDRLLVSLLDVTDRNRMEAALRGLDRLAAKGQMAAYVAHEVNNPLAGIKNAFTLLVPAISPDHPHRHYGDLIRREIDRIAGIIRTLVDVYRQAPRTSGPVPLAEVFQDLQSLLIPKCRPSQVVIFQDLAEPGLQVACDGGMLRQVLFNLALNAVEASPREGTVVLGARRSGSGVVITVRDQGPGIPPEWTERVFEPGFTTKVGSDMSGLGLGLATCRSLVATMGGTLGFTGGGPDPGCTFRVELPGTPPPLPPSTLPEAAPWTPPPGS